MAIATITQSTISGNLTAQLISNGIRDALITAGYTLHHSYLTGSNEVRVMALQQSNAAKGIIYLILTLSGSSGSLFYYLAETWNNSTIPGTATNSTSSSSFTVTFGASSAVNIYSISHPEFKGVSIEQGATQTVIGIIRPLTNNLIPSWWNENINPYGFLTRVNITPSGNRFGATTTPFINSNNVDFEYLHNSKMQDGNPVDNDRRSTAPFSLWHLTPSGIMCTSDDIIICASNTMRMMNTVTVSAQERYTYFWINSTNSGLAIRTT